MPTTQDAEARESQGEDKLNDLARSCPKQNKAKQSGMKQKGERAEALLILTATGTGPGQGQLEYSSANFIPMALHCFTA